MASAASTSSVLHSAGEIARDIKLHHSVFALPFAVLGAFMAAAPPGGAAAMNAPSTANGNAKMLWCSLMSLAISPADRRTELVEAVEAIEEEPSSSATMAS